MWALNFVEFRLYTATEAWYIELYSVIAKKTGIPLSSSVSFDIIVGEESRVADSLHVEKKTKRTE